MYKRQLSVTLADFLNKQDISLNLGFMIKIKLKNTYLFLISFIKRSPVYD